MKSLFAAIPVSIALFAGSAWAADVESVPAYDWSGAFIGLQAGYGDGGDFDAWVDIPSIPDGAGDPFGGNMKGGFIGGGHIGYNIMAGEIIVLGVVADLEATGLKGVSDVGDTIEMKLPIIGSLRARAGFAFDNLLIYGTGGLAGADADYSTTIQGTNSKENGTLWGYTVGGGIEYGISESFTAGIEYRYTDFGNERYSPEVLECSIGPDPVPCDFVTPASFHAVRATVSYHF